MTSKVNMLERLRYANSLGLRYRTIAMLLILQLASSLFEWFGVSMMLPLMELYSAGGDPAPMIEQSPFWQLLADFFSYLNLPLTLLALTIATGVILIGRSFFVYIHKVYKSSAVNGLLRDIRNRMFRESLTVAIDSHDQASLGKVVNDVLVEADRAVGAINVAIMLIGMFILISIYVGMLIAISPEMTALLLVTVLIEGLLLRGLLRRTKNLGLAYTKANQNFSSYLTERLRSLRHIRMSGTEKAEIDTAGTLTTTQFHQAFGIAKVTAQGNLITEFLLIGTLFLFFYLGVTVFEMPLAVLIVFGAMVLRLLMLTRMALGKAQTMLAEFAGFSAVEERLAELSAKQEVDRGEKMLDALKVGVEFRDVSFTYASREGLPALRSIDLNIPTGSMTAIVGQSGAGKSTLIDLLPRLREPTDGEIKFDGIPLREFKLSSLRRGISYVPQQPQLFNVTVAEHIRYGRPDATEAQIREAAELSGAIHFINELPAGYETDIGEAGVELSGGQRQRLDMSRALIGGAPILILDEPTSNLDAEAEQSFRATLHRILTETSVTIVVVAHRFSTIVDADQIVVLEGGRVSDTGTHAELISRGGWYAQAYAKQSEHSSQTFSENAAQ